MLDVHTHILPGMDDGSRSLERSLAMLQQEAGQGVDTVALTPHYDARSESPREFARRRALAEESLRLALASNPDVPRLIPGAEVAFFEGLSRTEELDTLCIGDTNSLLLEMPFCPWTQRMLDEVVTMRQVQGIRIILAHIERYRAFQPAQTFRELREQGVWLQCNASFFLRWQTRRQAMGLLKRKLVSFVASDCHGLEHRPPNLGPAMEMIRRKLGQEAVDSLLRNEQRLLGGMK